MEIKAHTWDRSLGGRDLDAVLVQHFGEQFKAKTGLDITQNPKSRFRMATQVTKTRQMLTINPEAPISVECLMEDTDFRYAASHISLETGTCTSQNCLVPNHVPFEVLAAGKVGLLHCTGCWGTGRIPQPGHDG